MDLSQARALEHLELFINSLQAQYPLLLRLLSTCSSSALRTVEAPMWFAGINLDPLPILESIDWSKLDDIVGDDHFPALTSFRVDVHPNCDTVPQTFFSEHLPRIFNRGILTSPALERAGKKVDKGKQRAS